MNIFEEFVEELKQEKLLEDTVIDPKADRKENPSKDDLSFDENEISSEVELEIQNENHRADLDSELKPDLLEVNEVEKSAKESSDGESNLDIVKESREGEAQLEEELEDDLTKKRNAYRLPLMDTVSSLQMVDHILAGVQREQMRTQPDVFDSFPIKQALHKFFEAIEALDHPKATEEESDLVKQVEVWHSALIETDSKISVADLRRFCESTNPTLSSQAVMSMVRFYRNSPFSEQVRSKFDLVATRLFSRDIGDNKREMAFERDELIEHVKELYADWASVPLYSEDDDDSDIVLAAFKFEDFISESAKVKRFDGLIKKGFFKRLKLFKKKTNENFFAPLLVAAAVESNVTIGNRYVDLIQEEKERMKEKTMSDKYIGLTDKSVSDETSKSLRLAELLSTGKTAKKVNSSGFNFGRSRLVFYGAGVLLFAVISIVFWMMFLSDASQRVSNIPNGTAAEKTIDFGDSPINKFLTSTVVKGDTLYATTTASWNSLPFEEREKSIKEILAAGKVMGYMKVQLSDSGGSAAAFATRNGINVVR